MGRKKQTRRKRKAHKRRSLARPRAAAEHAQPQVLDTAPSPAQSQAQDTSTHTVHGPEPPVIETLPRDIGFDDGEDEFEDTDIDDPFAATRSAADVRSEAKRLLIFGEEVVVPGKQSLTHRYPSQREIAARLGVSKSTIGRWCVQDDCMNLREQYESMVLQRAGEKVVEQRSENLSNAANRLKQLVQRVLDKWQDSFENGQIKVSNIKDLETLTKVLFAVDKLDLTDPDEHKDPRVVAYEMLLQFHQMTRANPSHAADPDEMLIPTATDHDPDTSGDLN